MAASSVKDEVASKLQSTNTDLDVMPTAVMGTNDSCTVSKRSVESLYYSRPHFYRYFVKKFKKRTALINRGYLLRMKAIEYELKTFLSTTTGKKAVINLGCGYDALPFRMLSCFSELCQNTTFIDVDYEPLMKEKIAIIQQIPELSSLLGKNDSDKQIRPVMLRSKNYLAVGCDLSKPEALQNLLFRGFDNNVSCFIISEVSITYMPVETADALIFWTSRLRNARFCLLEQCLPNGPNHPFASTMLKHFDKLSSPIRVVQTYQTTESQEARFRNCGWKNVRADSLWKIWQSGKVIDATERQCLRSVEMFDEHEEFALFAAHYFLLTASSSGPNNHQAEDAKPPKFTYRLKEFAAPTNKLSPRRDGVIFESQNNVLAYHGGDDGRSRLSTTQLYAESNQSITETHALQGAFSPRKHHTITRLNLNNDYILIGGRESPEKAFQDCWIWRNGAWIRADDLPIPLFRHCATIIPETSVNSSKQSAVVVFGGKTRHDKDSNAWFLWRENQGWTVLAYAAENVLPRFGANIVYFPNEERGILLGGMVSSEIVSQKIFAWSLHKDKILIKRLDADSLHDNETRLFRFGAVMIPYRDYILIIGGIALEGLPAAGPNVPGDVLVLNRDFISQREDRHLLRNVSSQPSVYFPTDTMQPLLVGHSATVLSDKLHIIGGGAICFSFGSFMNSTSWSISQDAGSLQVSAGLLKELKAPVSHALSANEASQHEADSFENEEAISSKHDSQATTAGFIAITKLGPQTRESLNKRIAKGRPCVYEEVVLGDCLREWSPDYLKQALPSEQLFDVHHAKSDTMLFESKNFEIRKEKFSDMMDSIVAGEKKYLRAVSLQDKHKPVSFHEDFKALSADFKLPEYLAIPNERQHSSVFRVSGPINMWLHYDTLSNILCQIRGSKRLLLFSPADVAHLKIPPGRSSSDIDVFSEEAWTRTSLKHTHPYEAILKPGDVLYIPPLWCHAALPLDGMSIAINIFFKSEDGLGYAQGKDTYGNKDVVEYEYARKDISKAIDRFAAMPRDTRRFYLERLADEISAKARKKE